MLKNKTHTCSNCNFKMQPQKYERQDLHRCPACDSIFLEWDALTKIMQTEIADMSKQKNSIKEQSSSKNTDDQEWSNKTFSEKEYIEKMARKAKRNCPVCSEKMESKVFNLGIKISVERCPEHGVFLDRGELEYLQAAYELHKEEKKK